MDPLKVLKLKKDFTLDQLKRHYKKMVMLYHPDRNRDGTDIKSSSTFQILTACYQMLLEDYNQRQMAREHHELKKVFKAEEKPKYAPVVNPSKKFDIDKFNAIFNEVKEKVSLEDDSGYGDWLKEKHDADLEKAGAIINYKDPEPLDSSILSRCMLIGHKTDDYSSDKYTDLKKAIMTSKIVDEKKVAPRKEYRNVDELKGDRENVSYTMTDEELKVYHKDLLKRQRREEERLKSVKTRDVENERSFDYYNNYMLRNF